MASVTALRKTVFAAFLLMMALLASVELFFFRSEVLSLGETWLFFLFLASGTVAVVLGRHETSGRLLALLLTCLAVLFSQVSPDQIGTLAGWRSWVYPLWKALQLAFPFLFVHFALVFPFPNRWIDNQPIRLALLYAPWLAVLIIDEWDLFPWLAWGALVPMTFLVSFLVGVAIFVSQYVYALTNSERNRLRLILIGCLSGALPFLLGLLTTPLLPFDPDVATSFLLPFFPFFLIVAVVKQNLERAGGAIRWLTLLIPSIAWFLSILILASAGFVMWTGALFGGPVGIVLGLLSAALTVPVFLRLFRAVSHSFELSPEEVSVSRFLTLGGRLTPIFGLPAADHPFTPVEPNPYIVGNPVRSSDMFFGRDAEFAFLRRHLRSRQEGCVVVLCGERRTGKTSILFQLSRGRLGSGYATAFVDMQAAVVNDNLEFFQIIASRIASSTDGAAPQLLCADDFALFLREVLESLEPRRLVLLLDEYELIEEKVGRGKLGPEIYAYLGSLLEAHPQLSLIMTGSDTLEARPAWAGLLGVATFRRIDVLARSDAEALIRTPVSDRIVIPGRIVDQMLRLANGHPFYTQFLCQQLVEAVNEFRRAHVDTRMLGVAVSRALRDPPPQLLYEWGGFGDRQKLVLAALGALLRGPSDFASWQRVGQMVESLPARHRHGLEGSSPRIELEGLRGQGCLDRDKTRYRFAMDLMRLWIAADHDIWKVLSEISGEWAGPR